MLIKQLLYSLRRYGFGVQMLLCLLGFLPHVGAREVQKKRESPFISVPYVLRTLQGKRTPFGTIYVFWGASNDRAYDLVIAQRAPENIWRRRGPHPYETLVYVISGGVRVKTSGPAGNAKFGPGSIEIVPPNTPHFPTRCSEKSTFLIVQAHAGGAIERGKAASSASRERRRVRFYNLSREDKENDFQMGQTVSGQYVDAKQITLKPGGFIPQWANSTRDSIIYVIDGKAGFTVAGRQFDTPGPQAIVAIPQNTSYSIKNSGPATLRLLIITVAPLNVAVP